MKKKQYTSRNGAFNGYLGKPMKWMMMIILVVAVLSASGAWVESNYPSVDMIEVSYAHGIRAEVFYNPYVGIPVVGTNMTYMELEFAEYADSVNWFVPDDAHAYYIASIVRADSAGIENYLQSVSNSF